MFNNNNNNNNNKLLCKSVEIKERRGRRSRAKVALAVLLLRCTLP
jgi:hypothetical protein